MVISTFTPEQIVDEFQKDFFNIVNYVEHQKLDWGVGKGIENACL